MQRLGMLRFKKEKQERNFNMRLEWMKNFLQNEGQRNRLKEFQRIAIL
jgi:hypothetical protein